LSPDGSRIALDIRDQENDIWIWEIARSTLTRITFDPEPDLFPVWTRDGRRLAFSEAHSGAINVYAQAADGTGTPERLTTAAYTQYPDSFTSDGSLLINELKPDAKPSIALWAAGGKTAVTPLLASSAAMRTAEISPDGKYVVYESDESSRSEIYVRPFPNVNDGRWQISTTGGTKPAWSPLGREIFYVDPTSQTLMSVPVQLSPTFRRDSPTRLFDAHNISTLASARFYDVTPDGQRFVMIKEIPPPPGQAVSTSPTFVFVVNWPEDVKAKLGK
jgi:serine/threonine-protein kinase